MRVGILSQWFTPETGPASIPGVLARGLVARGHDVAVLTGYPNYPTGVLYDGYSMWPRRDHREHGYAIRRVALYPNHSNRASGRLLNYGSFAASAVALGTSALRGIDVLWVYNSPASVALPMWLAKARFHVPIVLHNMDMWPDSVLHTGFAPTLGQRAMFSGLNAWVNAMYRTSSRVAYVTPAAYGELARRGVPRTKLQYAPLWVDESVFRPVDGTKLRLSLGFTQSDLVIGYAGALGRAQNIVELARTVAALPEPTPVKLMILGSGTESSELRSLASVNPKRIRFIGHVDHSLMTAYAAVPDISFVGLSPGGQASFAAPSKVSAIMACGKPILAAASGDTAMLIQRSNGGIVIEPGDRQALRTAIEIAVQIGHEGLHKMGSRALQFSRDELSEDKCISRMENILAGTIRSTPSAATGTAENPHTSIGPSGFQ